MNAHALLTRLGLCSLLLMAIPLAGVLPVHAAPPAAAMFVPLPQAEPPTADGGSPLLFIENVGQFAAGARFQVRGGSGDLWLADDALWITLLEPASNAIDPAAGRFRNPLGPLADPDLQPTIPPRRGVNLRVSFPNANPHPRLEPFDPQATVISYFLGNDPAQWRPDVPVWGGVRYVDLYPGIDLEVTGEGGQWVPRLQVRPGADLSQVQMQVDGAETLAVDGGRLRVGTAVGEYGLPLLLLPADSAGEVPAVTGNRVLRPFVAAALSATERGPRSESSDLLYGTFLGGNGSGSDQGIRVTIDGSGAAYVTGQTTSTDFSTTVGAFDTIYNGGDMDVIVVKLDQTGSALVFATFLGGSSLGTERGAGIAVDQSGATYVTGSTPSADFPTILGGYDTTYNGGDYDAFVIKLNPAGSDLVYGTFLGGSETDFSVNIGVDGGGSAYVTGGTGSPDFSTSPGIFSIFRGMTLLPKR